MDFHPTCKAEFCKICHAHLHDVLLKEQDASVPGYAKLTVAQKTRLIENAMDKPRRHRSSLHIPRTGTGLMSLPVEVRLQIYRNCIHGNAGNQFRIKGWYKGGGTHADKAQSPMGCVTGMYIFASHTFSHKILCLCKTVYIEAKDEIYRNICFRVEARKPLPHLDQLGYWLTKHPMTFMKQLSITMSFPVSAMTNINTSRWNWFSRRVQPVRRRDTNLNDQDIKRLATLVRKMLNLERVTLELWVGCYLEAGWYFPSLYKHCMEDVQYMNRLKAFRDALPSHVPLRLRVSFPEWDSVQSVAQPQAYIDTQKNQKEQLVGRFNENGFDTEMTAQKRSSTAMHSWAI